MKIDRKFYVIGSALALFIGLPLLLYGLSAAPTRSFLKEIISILTILAVFLILGQLFLTRSNEGLRMLFDGRQVQTTHKFIAYGAVGWLLLHPLLIVFPRFFEAGVKPLDALVTMLTTFENLGILLGLTAWLLLLVLGFMSVFRMRIMKLFGLTYRKWRYIHGSLSIIFLPLGLWHAIELGRHVDLGMAAAMIFFATVGIAMLAVFYAKTVPQDRAKHRGRQLHQSATHQEPILPTPSKGTHL
ncbi:ferric reductase-like transmembrane domain-containing protein [Cohaesibacter celericrescens]|uniref:FAD/NAD(P)-binding:oxidoreductase n=1 Tax=Cohaesibacter celericrescens TaxID=2067669 RepID=A0A2N5XPU3_9HYPH|nr:ferric reductase-like transmembrane domain-containing protein [Cohaesibacter celericrescens]PLW76457.1 FAD/NAD(P)-binding:oxidoreductase [Cohaesibacter celericrescens]